MGKGNPSEVMAEGRNRGATKSAPALVPQMDLTVRDDRMAIGNQKLLEYDKVGTLLQAHQTYFAPHAMDSPYQDAVQFSHFRKTTQTIDEFLALFDFLWRNAAGRI